MARVLHSWFSNILDDWLETRYWFCSYVKDVRGGSGVIQSRAELLWSGRELTTKVGEQPWPQLVHCALICCCMCSCIFQEDRIVVRSSGEEWYILIGVKMDIK